MKSSHENVLMILKRYNLEIIDDHIRAEEFKPRFSKPSKDEKIIFRSQEYNRQ
jgi:hypothetical protein